jgi:plastocyanin
MKRTLAALAGIALLLAACSKSTPSDTSPAASASAAGVTIRLTEFNFLMPDTIPAGVQTLHVENVGGMPHFVEFQRIKGGKSDEDIQAFLDDPASLQGPPPAWVSAAHMPSIGLLSPGASTDVSIDLPPGRYAAFCWMPDAQGNPHAILGMHHVFEVVGDPTGALPQADFTLTWNGSELEGVPSTIAPGTTATIAYSNTGDKAADISMGQVLKDLPADQLNAAVNDWFNGLYAGPAPVQFLGGLSGLKPGAGVVGTTTVTFADGVYGFGGPGKSEPILVTVGAGGYPAPEGSMDDMTCTADGTELSLSASQVAFDTHCLAAPAGQAFTIAFDNEDPSTQHNVAIYPKKDGSDAMFAGTITTGPSTTTYHVDALDAGTYRFLCQIHPTTMNGTFIVS